MNRIYLEYHDKVTDKHRFYQLWIAPSIFDDWSLVKEWGRVGASGTVRKEWFTTEEEAIVARGKITETKLKKGYFIKL